MENKMKVKKVLLVSVLLLAILLVVFVFWQMKSEKVSETNKAVTSATSTKVEYSQEQADLEMDKDYPPFTVQKKSIIHSSLPEYVFEVNFDMKNGRQEYGSSTRDVRYGPSFGNTVIKVMVGGKVIQVLQGEIVDFSLAKPGFANLLNFEDINRDGYKDLDLFKESGTGGGSGTYWLYDPKTGLFNYNKGLSDLGGVNVVIEGDKKIVRSVYFSGAAGNNYSKQVFELTADNVLIAISEEHQEMVRFCADKKEACVPDYPNEIKLPENLQQKTIACLQKNLYSCFLRSTKKLINGEMKLTEQVLIEI